MVETAVVEEVVGDVEGVTVAVAEVVEVVEVVEEEEPNRKGMLSGRLMLRKRREVRARQQAKRERMRETPRGCCRVHSTSGGTMYGGNRGGGSDRQR
jgi:hypothetical protein